MNITMTVFSVDPVRVNVPATLADGTEVVAAVPGLRVQLTSGTHGTWTLNLTGDDAVAWTAAAGSTVDVTIA